MRPTAATSAWKTLARRPRTSPLFDVDSLIGLPPPAQRHLERVLPPRTPLATVVRLEMSGELKVGSRWLPFQARQILSASTGFVWSAEVGGRFLRFSGADVMEPDGSSMEFRLLGLIPVVRSSGPDIARSAAGRLAAETVAWLPQALAPQSGARWTTIDDRHATVTLRRPCGTTSVDVEVDDEGRLRSVGLQRWNSDAKPPQPQPFGGRFGSEFATGDGVLLANDCEVGWGWNTGWWPSGRFFTGRIRSVDGAGPTAP